MVDKGKKENEKEEKVILGAGEMKMVEGEGNKIEGLEAKGESGEMLVDKVESEEMLEDKVESHEMVKMEEGEKDYGVNESKMKKWEKVWLDAWNLEMERRKTAKVLAEEKSQVLRNSDMMGIRFFFQETDRYPYLLYPLIYIIFIKHFLYALKISKTFFLFKNGQVHI